MSSLGDGLDGLKDVVPRVATWLIMTALLGSILKWYRDRKKRISRVKMLLFQLQEELQANKQLLRQAQSRPYDTYLNSALGEQDLDHGLREQLRVIDGYIKTIKSFNDKGIANSQTVGQVFKDNLAPSIEQAFPLLAREKARWDAQRWWKKIPSALP